MTKSNAITTVGNVSVVRGGQEIRYKALLRMAFGSQPAHSLRLEVRYDSYQDQSHGKIERWSGSEWNEVYYLSGAELKGWSQSMYARRQAPAATDFLKDVAELQARAEEVLR